MFTDYLYLVSYHLNPPLKKWKNFRQDALNPMQNQLHLPATQMKAFPKRAFLQHGIGEREPRRREDQYFKRVLHQVTFFFLNLKAEW